MRKRRCKENIITECVAYTFYVYVVLCVYVSLFQRAFYVCCVCMCIAFIRIFCFVSVCLSVAFRGKLFHFVFLGFISLFSFICIIVSLFFFLFVLTLGLWCV